MRASAPPGLHDRAKQFLVAGRRRFVTERLPVPVAAHLAAQLPELLRGVFYYGWNTARMPIKYDSAEYARRFAREATIRDTEVPRTASLVARLARRHLSGGALDEALGTLPAEIR